MIPRPLPARIVIPVANPATAEELIRLGADLLEPRGGELTALGIVEVPEGMRFLTRSRVFTDAELDERDRLGPPRCGPEAMNR